MNQINHGYYLGVIYQPYGTKISHNFIISCTVLDSLMFNMLIRLLFEYDIILCSIGT
jgi:hypothetical protein